MKYRVKQAYPIYWLDPTTVRIGAQEGVTRQFRDPEGQLRFLLGALDSCSSTDEVLSHVRSAFPNLDRAQVLHALEFLASQGILENADLEPVGERFVVNQRFFSAAAHKPSEHDVQSLIRKSSVALLGLGGGGSAILPQLISLGFGRIRGVDQDIVEESNLNRQFLFHESMVGESKALSAAKLAENMSAQTKFEAVHTRLNSVQDVLQVIGDVDVAICAIDEPAFLIHRLVNAAAITAGVPVVYMLSQVTRGRVFSVRPNKDGCVDCLHIHYTKQDPNFFRQFDALSRTSIPGETAAISPHILRLTSFAADECVRLVTDYAAPLTCQTQYEIDYLSGASGPLLSWPRADECPTCGTGDESDTESLAAYSIEPSRA